jgi:hypothetical protein
MTTAEQGRRRHAPRSGVRCPQMQFHTMTPAEHPSVDDGVFERGFFAYRLAGVQMMGMGSSLCEDSAVECDADDAPRSIINRFKDPPRIPTVTGDSLRQKKFINQLVSQLGGIGCGRLLDCFKYQHTTMIEE